MDVRLRDLGHLPGRHISALSRLYLGYLGYISAISRLYLGFETSVTFQVAGSNTMILALENLLPVLWVDIAEV